MVRYPCRSHPRVSLETEESRIWGRIDGRDAPRPTNDPDDGLTPRWRGGVIRDESNVEGAWWGCSKIVAAALRAENVGPYSASVTVLVHVAEVAVLFAGRLGNA